MCVHWLGTLVKNVFSHAADSRSDRRCRRLAPERRRAFMQREKLATASLKSMDNIDVVKYKVVSL